MQLDTDKNGLATIFKEWQVPLIEELFTRTLTSRQAYEVLEELDVKTGNRENGSVSRASVINSLNSMVTQGLIVYKEESCRGGSRRIYEMAMTREEFMHKIMDTFIETLEALPESSTYLWPEPQGL